MKYDQFITWFSYRLINFIAFIFQFDDLFLQNQQVHHILICSLCDCVFLHAVSSNQSINLFCHIEISCFD